LFFHGFFFSNEEFPWIFCNFAFSEDLYKNSKIMLLSMTGFGKASVQLPDKKITAEIKSLNSKQFPPFSENWSRT